MSVNGDDFIKFANNCLHTNDEIGYRNAIGRAYYGVYHKTCSILEKCPHNTHIGVREYLAKDSWLKHNEPYAKMKLLSVSAILTQLHTQRKWADYEISEDIGESDAVAALKLAQRGMDKITEMVEEIYPSN
ncbi:hypothetical protein EYY86_14560 [Hafnia paralvei]|uniref:hypothetical protein n=1 Tax=Hafnia paralvei TaxID=546367 RepID=UPI001034CA59|nr:hypothetical protein [Hafnia paralvei]TBM13500.1 hypothetical protein EYY86_14560 [Hafnia paralvei]